ncbi:MAG: hypothetical protein JO254_11530 [Pseudolabrys sp.]|nr:hypothetical protein [Pseudolabrys sp.]
MIRRLFFTALLLAVPHVTLADECGDTVRDYNAVLSRVSEAVEQFTTCVADSKGMDTCNKQFGTLRSVHSQFASVVAIYSKQCEVPLK